MMRKRIQWVLLIHVCFILFLLQNKLFSVEQKRKDFMLNEEQKKLVDLINSERNQEGRKAFSVNMGLTEALTGRLEALIHDKLGKEGTEKKIEDFLSNLGQNAFMTKASSIKEAFSQLRENKKFEKILHHSEEMAVALSVLKVNSETTSVILYFTECPVEWGASRLDLGLDVGSDKFLERFLTITGTSKSGYLKFLLHTGKIFYFECESCKKVVKEISVEKNGSFSVTFPVQMFGKEERRVAVLARDSRTEKYVLVDYLLRR